MANNRKLPRTKCRSGRRASPIEMPEFEPRPQIIGYARVSTEEQSLDMQIKALDDAGCDIIFKEKVSAKDLRRPEYRLMRKHLQRGDTVVVYAFSRLSRDLEILLRTVREFKDEGIDLRSTSEPHINPFTTNGRLLLSVVGAVDENERGRIRDRTIDGMAERKRQGQRMGRPEVLTPAQIRQAKTMRKTIPVTKIARKFGVSVTKIYNVTA